MAARSSMVHVRVDDDTKEKASLALDAMGLSLSDGIRLFLRRVIDEQALPFPLTVPNGKTLAATDEAKEITRRRSARFSTAQDIIDAIEKEAGLEEAGRR